MIDEESDANIFQILLKPVFEQFELTVYVFVIYNQLVDLVGQSRVLSFLPYQKPFTTLTNNYILSSNISVSALALILN